MWWLDDIIIPVLLIVGVCCFLLLVGFRTRMLTRRTNRTAENMYDNYADSVKKQRKYARDHGGTWTDDEGKSATLTNPSAPPPKTATSPARPKSPPAPKRP